MRQTEKQSLVRRVFSAAMLAALLIMMPRTFGQHLTGGGHPAGFGGGQMGGFSGGHLGAFNGGGFRGGFSAPRTFGGFSTPAQRGLGTAPRINLAVPHSNFVPKRNSYAGYRPRYGAGGGSGWDHRGRDHRGRYHRPYPGYGYGGYPYLYANSWKLLPWDIGYPDFTGYGGDNEDNEAAESNNGQVQPSGDEQEQQQPEGEGYRPEYVPAPYASPTNQMTASAPLHNDHQLTLIFKDGHIQSIRNFVLTPSEVIVMDDAASGCIPRISISELNLPATEKAAKRAGLDFSPPSA